MNKIMTANFQGAEILGVQLDGAVFVVLKPLVEAMGLAWNAQLERIKRDAVLYEGMRIMRIPSLRGGDQETVTLRLDRLHGWLFTVILLVSAMKSGSGSRPFSGNATTFSMSISAVIGM